MFEFVNLASGGPLLKSGENTFGMAIQVKRRFGPRPILIAS
jgi:hypothetical protein